MKTITIILFSILLNACGSAKTTVNEEKNLANNHVEVSKITQENVKIKYRTHARGNFQEIILDNKTISVQKGYDAKPTIKPCSDNDWSAITALVESSNLKAMTTLEAPSKAHQYDGAPMANFTITKGETIYDLKTFDAGNPHEECAKLINMVINIATTSK